jgi:hypothetical protein
MKDRSNISPAGEFTRSRHIFGPLAAPGMDDGLAKQLAISPASARTTPLPGSVAALAEGSVRSAPMGEDPMLFCGRPGNPRGRRASHRDVPASAFRWLVVCETRLPERFWHGGAATMKARRCDTICVGSVLKKEIPE